MPGELFRHQRRALAFMLQRERGAGSGPAGGILADDQVPAAATHLHMRVRPDKVRLGFRVKVM
jgi:hypothetical protein